MQKSLILLFILSIQCLVAQSDDDKITVSKGTQNVALDFRFSAAQNDRAYLGSTAGEESKLFGISTSYGVAVAENLIVGAHLEFKYDEAMNSRDDIDQMKIIERFYAFGIYAKKYWNLSDRFLINGRAGVDYGFFKISKAYTDRLDGFTDGNMIRAGLRPGLTYFFTEHFALEGTFGFIGYTSTKLEDPDAGYDYYSKNKSFDVQFGASEISLGISYYF